MKTKHLILLPLIFLFQTISIGQLALKVGVGPQISNRTSSSSDLTYDFRLGFNADVRAVFMEESKLKLEVGLAYNQKGDNYEFKFGDRRWPSQHDGNGGFNPNLPTDTLGNFDGLSGFRFTYLNSYIEIPIQVDYYLSSAEQGIYVLGSLRPSYSFLHKYKVTERLANGNNGEQEITNSQFEPKRFNLLARAGLGFEIEMEGLNFFAEAYYERQLLNTVSNPIFSTSIQQYGIGLLLGVKF